MQFSSLYPLKPFQETRFEKLKLVIEHYPLATVISQTQLFPMVSQIPLILDKQHRRLLGHLDMNNPHCESIKNGGEIYCLFSGPNHYISPSIYADEQFPGWNYVSVHVTGTVKPLDNPEALVDILLKTAQHNEPPNSNYVLNTSQKNFNLFSSMIVGFEIEIIDAKGVFKLAQDKSIENTRLAASHLNHASGRDISSFLGQLL